ncbi:hypothetical protein [Cylindrospermum sp. FACHB-282]|uniref:hypothetical protein n=1 Tax=Cylindrospermum sp. FACHB-282 TaxID=2692794 RepID=UPI0016886BCC|nr:hypothetical protein [Cylindrospermum sp. FACHB-282]MBD2386453.1 hypothetical protein [Cylindrospermum sp. FACHB-282]
MLYINNGAFISLDAAIASEAEVVKHCATHEFSQKTEFEFAADGIGFYISKMHSSMGKR